MLAPAAWGCLGGPQAARPAFLASASVSVSHWKNLVLPWAGARCSLLTICNPKFWEQKPKLELKPSYSNNRLGRVVLFHGKLLGLPTRSSAA